MIAFSCLEQMSTKRKDKSYASQGLLFSDDGAFKTDKAKYLKTVMINFSRFRPSNKPLKT